MKTATPAMAAHLKSDTTTLTTCWKIIRQDGEKFFYTELDRDVKYQGDIYKSAAGFESSAMKSSAAFAIDEMDVHGVLSDDSISDIEMRNGAFDWAKVEIFMVNYEDETMGKIMLRTGNFGEVRTTSSGGFMVELRGLVDMLGQKIGNTYLPECRTDVGSPLCGIELAPPVHRRGEDYKVGDRVRWPVDDPDNDPPRYYSSMVKANPGNWQIASLAGEDMNVQSHSGNDKMVAQGNGSTVYCRFSPADIGLSQADIDSGNYQVTFQGWSYEYYENSSGFVQLSYQYFIAGAGIYVSLTTPDGHKNVDLPWTVPKRRWRKFSVTLPVHPATGRIEVAVGCYTDPDNVARRMFYDDMQISVSRVDADDNPGYQIYGGIEFRCKRAGTTSRASDVTFDSTIGAEITDGEVIWECVHPQYKFLGSMSAKPIKTNFIVCDNLPNVEDGWFDWGVVTFLTGQNAGRSVEAMDYDPATGKIRLALPVPYQSEIGDLFTITVGCDKRIATCLGKFNNAINFRGHPWVPGQGAYFKVAGM